ncbi:hypothetical protein L484_020060 [Morus notabilis]|uniref:Uncharacterized protein n=1 Tax=Morus notabilis TaxID=981085 RepID=W9SBX9_9ROSA|nr:hypothetical protein L484_020060 [Morus notabilis]
MIFLQVGVSCVLRGPTKWATAFRPAKMRGGVTCEHSISHTVRTKDKSHIRNAPLALTRVVLRFGHCRILPTPKISAAQASQVNQPVALHGTARTPLLDLAYHTSSLSHCVASCLPSCEQPPPSPPAPVTEVASGQIYRFQLNA